MNNLGNIIKTPAIRHGLYIGYVLTALAVGAAYAAFTVGDAAIPIWLERAQAAIAYLAIPFGSLAAANVPRDIENPELLDSTVVIETSE